MDFLIYMGMLRKFFEYVEYEEDGKKFNPIDIAIDISNLYEELSPEEKDRKVYEYISQLVTGRAVRFRCGNCKTFHDGIIIETNYIKVPPETSNEDYDIFFRYKTIINGREVEYQSWHDLDFEWGFVVYDYKPSKWDEEIARKKTQKQFDL